MISFKNLFGTQKKSVIAVSSINEQTREGINKSYIPKFLYKPPFGYPRYSDLSYVRYLAQTPYVEMCIDTIIKEITSIGWDIVPNEGMEELADDTEIEQIRNFFLNPNTNKETFQQVFIEMPVRDILEVNTAVLNKIYNLKGELVEVVARDGATFTVNPDIHGMFTNRDDIILPNKIVTDTDFINPYTEITATDSRERAAYFQYGWIAGPMPIPFGKKEIIWIQGMKRTDDHYGYSPIQILSKNLQMLLYMIESDLEYYNDNNVPKGIIGLEESDADEIQAFKEQWFQAQRARDEFGNWKKMMHKVPIVNKVPVFQRIEFSSTEMQVIEKQEWYTKMVWASFGVTPTELGYTQDASGAANQIVQSKVFKKKAINPLLRKLESAYNHDIIPEFGFTGKIKTKSGKTIERQKYKFVFKTFDIDDETAKYNLYKLQTENGLKTINEIRKAEGLPELEWGDSPPREWQQSDTTMMFNGFPGVREPAEDEDYPDMQENALNPRKPQEDVEDKAQDPQDNPLNIKEGEDWSGSDKLEKALKYANSEQKKQIEELLKNELGNKPIQSEAMLNRILDRIAEILGVNELQSVVFKAIKDNYFKGWEEAEKQLNMNIIPDNNAIDFINNYTFDNIKDVNADIANKLKGVFSRAFMNGESPAKIKEEINKVFDVGNTRIEAITRTESNRAANFGRLHGFQKSGIKGKKVYSAHLDHRTSALCKRLNGQKVDLNEDFVDPKGEWSGPVPPAHVNCRSSWIFEPEFTEEPQEAEQKAELKYKYIKRTGGPGHYRYWYQDSKTGNIKEGTKPQTHTKKDAEDFAKNSIIKDTVYHGTSSERKEDILYNGFKNTRSGGYGHWFFFNKDHAKPFANNKEDNIVKAKVNLKKIKVYKNRNELLEDVHKFGKGEGTHQTRQEEAIFKYLKKEGFEGYIFPRQLKNQKTLVVFDAKNVMPFED